MVRRTLLTIAAAMMMAVMVQAQTVDEIIAKNLEAKGGLENIKAVKSMKLTGKMSMGQMEAPFVVTMKRPSMFRVDFTIQGMTGTQAYDGETAWSLMPFMGKTDPEKMNEEQTEDFKQQADFDGPLMNWKEKGNKVELAGEDEVEGTPVYKLKVTLPNGDETFLYLDKDSYLEIQSTAKREMQGQEMEFVTTMGDYKEVEGLVMPMSIASGAKGSPQQNVMSIENVEVNPQIEDSSFHMPEVKAAPEPAKN